MDSLYLVMPAYNEEANIEAVVNMWYPVLEGKDAGSRVVIADSGSSDATHDILLTLQKTHPQLELLSDTDRRHGPKVIALYAYAIRRKADYIFQTDSDGQTDPSEFAAFWDMRERFDAILGSRNHRGDGKSRAFVERVVCFLLRIYFGVRVPDANAPFRLMKASLVQKYLDRLPSDYHLPNVMLTAFFAHYHEALIFQIITFKPRQGGVNSINIPKIVRIGWKAISDFRVFRKGMKD